MRHKSTELMGTIKAFVEEYYKNYRHSPSTTEIANAVGIARGTAYKYLLAMSDNGMIRYDGQQISTEQTEKVQTEFTSVALVGNENTLKRYFVDKENQKIRLHPENKSMKDIIVSDCVIQGVAVISFCNKLY